MNKENSMELIESVDDLRMIVDNVSTERRGFVVPNFENQYQKDLTLFAIARVVLALGKAKVK